jgi:hypothetical protein
MRTEVRTASDVRQAADPMAIAVLYTTAGDTRAALEHAGSLAHGLNVALRLIVLRTVPFPLPLIQPPVPVAFTERQMRKFLRAISLDARVSVYDCREPEKTLSQLLPERSVVVIGARRRWFPTRHDRLARRLRREGHDVILVDGRNP